MLSYKEALRKIFERADYERGDRPPYAERTWHMREEIFGGGKIQNQRYKAYKCL